MQLSDQLKFQEFLKQLPFNPLRMFDALFCDMKNIPVKSGSAKKGDSLLGFGEQKKYDFHLKKKILNKFQVDLYLNLM